MAGHVCFDIQLSLILGIMNSTDRREEKRNFLIQGRRFRRSFKNYCNYRYFMKLSRLLSIVKLGIDVLLSEHLQSRCIDSSMYRYTPIYQILLPWSSVQEKAFVVDLEKRDGGLGLSVSVSTIGVVVFDDRVCFFAKITSWILKSKKNDISFLY